MPDEKIDQKRPVHAEMEDKRTQQRHVDDTVDDSFPASDPPAWTTSASKSVAAECEPEKLNEIPVPPGEPAEASGHGFAHALRQRGQAYWDEGRRHLPEAERYYRQGSEAVSRSVQEHPVAAVVAVGVIGCALGWLLGRRMADAPMQKQWSPGSNRRPQATQTWRPAPEASRRASHHPARNRADVASHTNNSF